MTLEEVVQQRIERTGTLNQRMRRSFWLGVAVGGFILAWYLLG